MLGWLIGRYIFEGLGHLVSTILINTAQYLKRINENGIKKMYVISPCLRHIVNKQSFFCDSKLAYL